MVVLLGLASCKEAPPPPPNEPPTASSADPDEIVLLQTQRARAALAARPADASSPSAGGDGGEMAGAEVLALLDGLKAGDLLGPAKVVHVGAVTHGSVVIDVEEGTQRGGIFFVKLGGGPLPPASSDRYAVYYRNSKAPNAIPAAALRTVCTSLADRLRGTEARVPPPSGLTAFATDQG